MSGEARLKLKAQLLSGEAIAMGPGKADLLEAIAQAGSLSGAGRKLGYSYRRTWLMVGEMNRCWREPLVLTSHGGAKGGGATLSVLGKQVLADYRALEVALADAAIPAWKKLKRNLA